MINFYMIKNRIYSILVIAVLFVICQQILLKGVQAWCSECDYVAQCGANTCGASGSCNTCYSGAGATGYRCCYPDATTAPTSPPPKATAIPVPTDPPPGSYTCSYNKCVGCEDCQTQYTTCSSSSCSCAPSNACSVDSDCP